MSNSPAPLALTAVMLAMRLPHFDLRSAAMNESHVAALASDLHRLAPAYQRHAISVCNGELQTGQRDWANRQPREVFTKWSLEMNESIAAYGRKLDKKLDRLNQRLAPFALRIDPSHGGGLYLGLESTDMNRPVGFHNSFPIVGKKG